MVGGIEGDTGRSTMNTKGKTNPDSNQTFIQYSTMFFVYNFWFYRRRELRWRCDASLQLPRFVSYSITRKAFCRLV